MLLGFLFFLRDFVAVFSKIHEAADGRNGGRGDFHQIHGVVTREVDRIGEWNNSELLAVYSDDADFAGADFTIDPDERGRRGIAWRKRAAQDTLVGCGIILKCRIKKTASVGDW